jgi:hypothetical protein
VCQRPGQPHVEVDASCHCNPVLRAAGKAGFQKADLMDYGSLFGMGAEILVALATRTEGNLTKAEESRPSATPDLYQQSASHYCVALCEPQVRAAQPQECFSSSSCY